MRLVFSNPRGMAPRVDPLLLEPMQAQYARNVRFLDNGWSSWNEPVFVAPFNKTGLIQSIYRFGQDATTDANYWFQWTTDVDIVRYARFANEGTIYSGDGVPKYTDATMGTSPGPLPSASYDLGLVTPTIAPSLSVSGVAGVGAQSLTIFVGYTFVDARGQESALSPISSEITAVSNQTINVSFLQIPAGNNSYTAKRIYATAGTGTSFYLRTEVAAGSPTASFVAARSTTPIPGQTGVGDALERATSGAPPADSYGVKYCAGNFLAMISGDSVVFSEADFLYAYKASNSVKPPFKPVALGTFGNTLVVGTKGRTMLYQGLDPEFMQEIKGDRVFACVSKRSMVDMDGQAVGYAAKEGFVVVSPAGSTLITGNFYSGREWAALKPETMMCVYWNGQVVCFFNDGAGRKGSLLLIPGVEPVELSLYATAAYVDPQRNSLYVAMSDAPYNGIYRFDSGAALPWVWKSKDHPMAKAMSWTGLQVKSDGAIRVEASSDGRVQWVVTATNDEIITVPGGYLGQKWSFEFSGTVKMKSCVIADNFSELTTV